MGYARAMTSCAACGEPSARQLFVKNGCAVFRCERCGLGRTDAAGFDPKAYYTEDYFSGGHEDGYGDYRAEEPVLRRQFARTVEFIRGFVPGGRLLELGCAYGFFLQEAKPYFDVTGIELAEDAAAYARANGSHVISGIADDATLAPLGMFDVIVLLDVIEHLPDPRTTLTLCDKHLNPDGIIVITTGDFGSLYARLSGKGWRLMTVPQHLWFFTRESMHGLARQLGLRIDRFDHPWKIVPLTLILFQLRRMLGFKPVRERGAAAVGVPVNLFDAMRVVLRKPGLS